MSRPGNHFKLIRYSRARQSTGELHGLADWNQWIIGSVNQESGRITGAYLVDGRGRDVALRQL